MTRFKSVLAVVFALAAVGPLGACDKPTAENCEKALRNMQALLGTDNLNTTENLQGEVRRCRGGSSKVAVQCAIDAKTLDQLEACEFEKTSKHLHGSGADSAAGSASPGSAATGSGGGGGSAQ